MSSTKISRRLHNEQRTSAELVTLLISVLLLGGLVGGLVWMELSRGDSRVRIDVQPHFSKVYHHADGWYLPVTITNNGDRATNMLRVDITRPIPGEDPETSDLSYQFVGGGQSVEGTAVFDERPTKDTIQVDVIGTTEP
jgi:uncharacterized protein (TIGR02588 family)